MIRILFVISDLSRAGAETQLVSLALSLDPQRYQRRIVLVKERNDFAEVLEKAGIPVVPLRRRGAADVFVLWRLWRQMRRFRPDVVHSFLLLANILSAVAGRLAGVSRIVLSQRCSYEGAVGPFWRRVARLSHRLADRVIVNSKAALQEEIDAGFPAERLIHVPNAVVAAPAARGDRPALGLPVGPLVLSVGQLESMKGHRFLVEAWPEVRRAHPEAHLVLVGDGPCRASLEEAARTLGVGSSITFTGFQSRVGPLLAACDLLVQPSLTEGSPNAVLEAMAAGKAVIASQVGGVPELVVDGVTGLLVPPGDPSALSRTIAALLEDADQRARMGAAGAARARAAFSPESACGLVEEVYAALAGAPSAG